MPEIAQDRHQKGDDRGVHRFEGEPETADAEQVEVKPTERQAFQAGSYGGHRPLLLSANGG